MISLSVSTGRSVVRATSSVTCFSSSPQVPRVIQVSTIRCDACGATAGRISSVNRASDERTFAVARVWCSSPNAITPPGSGSSVAIAACGDATLTGARRCRRRDGRRRPRQHRRRRDQADRVQSAAQRDEAGAGRAADAHQVAAALGRGQAPRRLLGGRDALPIDLQDDVAFAHAGRRRRAARRDLRDDRAARPALDAHRLAPAPASASAAPGPASASARPRARRPTAARPARPRPSAACRRAPGRPTTRDPIARVDT